MLVALIFVQLAEAKDFFQHLHIEAFALGFCQDFLFPSFNALISSSMCSMRSMNERMRSPEIPIVSVVPAPLLKRTSR